MQATAATTIQSFTPGSGYIADVERASSAGRDWAGLMLFRADEPSAQVDFEDVTHNLLNLTRTGTLHHEARFADVRDDRPTRPGDVLRLPAGAAGRFSFVAPPGGERTVIALFDPTLLEDHCPEVLPPGFQSGVLVPGAHAPQPILARCLEMLDLELDAATARGPLFAETVIRLLAIEIATSHWSRRPRAPLEARFDTRQAKLIDALLDGPLSAGLSLRDMAGACGMSIGPFSRAFKARFGRSACAHVREVRLRRAASLLASSNLPLVEIAIATGFCDQQHLSRSIRRRFRCTPTDIRRGGR